MTSSGRRHETLVVTAAVVVLAVAELGLRLAEAPGWVLLAVLVGWAVWMVAYVDWVYWSGKRRNPPPVGGGNRDDS